MTIPEEIEIFKNKLTPAAIEAARLTGTLDEAALLLELIGKYAKIQSTDSKPYIERLMQVAEKTGSVKYEACALYHLAFIDRLTGEYDRSIELSGRALPLFESIGDMEYIPRVLNNIGVNHYRKGNFTEAIENYQRALTIREQTNDKSGMAIMYNNIAIIEVQQGNNTGGLKNFMRNLQIQLEIGSLPDIALSYNNIGVIHAALGNYPEALKNYFESLKVREQIGDQSGIAVSYNNIGVIYYNQGNYAQALQSHQQALRIREEIGDKDGMNASYNNMGVAYHKLGNYDEALRHHLMSLNIKESIGDRRTIASSYNNIGSIYFVQQRYDEALKNHLLALEIAIELADKREMIACYIGIGSVNEKQGAVAEAEKNKLLALQLSEEIADKNFIRDSTLSLSLFYRGVNDFENALSYHEKFHTVESEMLGEQSQKQLNNLSFMHNLEQKEKDLEIEHLRNVELKKEKDRSEALLLNILPAEVAEELKEKGTADAKLFDDVTVLFTDFKSFTKVSERLTPQQLVDELHACFSAFDGIMAKYGLEKIKTVGDAYLAISGLPVPNQNHAADMVKAAIDIREFMLSRKKELGESTFEIRIGIHSGSVVAGIVGIKKFAYDIWGDTVNTAARMEQNSEAGRINISETAYQLVGDKFSCEYRGEIEAKNKGKLKMYFVN